MLSMRRLSLLLALAFAACGEDAKPHESGSHDDHNHAPKYGGRLVELGAHEFQIELLLYPDEGQLEAYLWDGHVEIPVPTAMKTMRIEGKAGGKDFTIELAQAKNPYAKEAEGKASKFSGVHAALKGCNAFTGTLVEVSLADKTFKAVAFEYTESSDHEHDHEHG